MGREGKRKRQGRNGERIKRDWEEILPHACLHMRNGVTAAVRRHVVLAWCHRHPYTQRALCDAHRAAGILHPVLFISIVSLFISKIEAYGLITSVCVYRHNVI
jgi:hypothetical protein